MTKRHERDLSKPDRRRNRKATKNVVREAEKEAWIQRQVDAAPPLTPDQDDAVTRIFRNAFRDGGRS